MAPDSVTLNELSLAGHRPADPTAWAPALAVLWCREEPHRIGEIIPLPPSSTPYAIGRGERAVTGHERAVPVRQVPGRSAVQPGFGDRRLSRHHLALSVAEGLHLRRVGRSRLLVDGRPVDVAELAVGQVVQVGNALLFLVTRRPAVLAGAAPAAHSFGLPDADGFVGESVAAWALRGHVAAAAGQRAHVLVQGPSGVGKEIVARAIARRSGRRPWVARSAATLPESLVESELFGHAADYPNAGMPARSGLVGEADGGVLFLDEIGELPDALQARLLRVLDDGEYHRLGDRRADLRILGATRRSFDVLREDLAARLEVRVRVPELGERAEDVPLLARHLVLRAAANEELAARFVHDEGGRRTPRFTPAFVRALVQRPWRTHVRELQAVVRASMTGSTGPWLDLVGSAPVPADPTPLDPNAIHPEHIQALLDQHDGLQEPVWRALGLSSRHVLTRLVRKYGLEVRGRGKR